MDATNGYTCDQVTIPITDASKTDNGYRLPQLAQHITGLSKLQRWILVKALESRNRNAGKVDLYYAEIKHQFFGLPIKNPRGWTWQGVTREAAAGRDFGHVFASTKTKDYAAVSASVSRAVSRLKRRGLIDVFRGTHAWWAGLSLTPQGVEVGAALRNTRIQPHNSARSRLKASKAAAAVRTKRAQEGQRASGDNH